MRWLVIEFGKMWKEAVVEYLNVSRHFHGVTEGKSGKSQFVNYSGLRAEILTPNLPTAKPLY